MADIEECARCGGEYEEIDMAYAPFHGVDLFCPICHEVVMDLIVDEEVSDL